MFVPKMLWELPTDISPHSYLWFKIIGNGLSVFCKLIHHWILTLSMFLMWVNLTWQYLCNIRPFQLKLPFKLNVYHILFFLKRENNKRINEKRVYGKRVFEICIYGFLNYQRTYFDSQAHSTLFTAIRIAVLTNNWSWKLAFCMCMYVGFLFFEKASIHMQKCEHSIASQTCNLYFTQKIIRWYLRILIALN